MMRFFLLGFAFLMMKSSDGAQIPTAQSAIDVKTVIEQLFTGMRTGDSSLVRQVFHVSARLQSVVEQKGIPQLATESVDEFVKAVGTPHPEIWDEQIRSWKIDIDGDLASVWTDYEFYLGKKYLHCGVNAFHLFKTAMGWKITQITDTRKKECQQSEKGISITEKVKPFELEINKVMDEWHMAAGKGDEDVFFGTMAEDFIYLGTDKTERWTKTTFWDFAKKYFERKEGAWKFKPLSRKIYFTDDLSYAWFEEHLDTWMGVCRGSGVLRFSEGKWMLKHYNLSVTINNDKVQEFIKLKPN